MTIKEIQRLRNSFKNKTIKIDGKKYPIDAITLECNLIKDEIILNTIGKDASNTKIARETVNVKFEPTKATMDSALSVVTKSQLTENLQVNSVKVPKITSDYVINDSIVSEDTGIKSEVIGSSKK